MPDTPQYDTSQLDEVQHPTLGPLKFPKAMPMEERNASIDRMLKEQSAPKTDQPKDEGFFKKALGFANGANQTLQEGQTGVLKGAAHTLTNLEDWWRKGGADPNDPANRISEHPSNPTAALASPQHQAILDSVKKWSQPTTLPEKIGFGGEQAAEFMLPESKIAEGVKAAEAGIDAAKLGKVASKALKLTARGGADAAGSAAVTAAQGGDVKTNAAVAGAVPFASAALKPVAKVLAEKAAPALANKLLRPVPTQIENAARFGRNPGQ